jgi:hypothetical protein
MVRAQDYQISRPVTETAPRMALDDSEAYAADVSVFYIVAADDQSPEAQPNTYANRCVWLQFH